MVVKRVCVVVTGTVVDNRPLGEWLTDDCTDESVPEGPELAAGAVEEVEFHQGMLEGGPEGGKPEDGSPELGDVKLDDTRLDSVDEGTLKEVETKDSGLDPEVLGPVVKGIGEELGGRSTEDVEFQSPVEDGRPSDGKPEDGSPEEG